MLHFLHKKYKKSNHRKRTFIKWAGLSRQCYVPVVTKKRLSRFELLLGPEKAMTRFDARRGVFSTRGLSINRYCHPVSRRINVKRYLPRKGKTVMEMYSQISHGVRRGELIKIPRHIILQALPRLCISVPALTHLAGVANIGLDSLVEVVAQRPILFDCLDKTKLNQYHIRQILSYQPQLALELDISVLDEEGIYHLASYQKQFGILIDHDEVIANDSYYMFYYDCPVANFIELFGV